jgi:hypothetical protein
VVGFVLIAQFFAKLKFIILPVLKFVPVILKTGGTMFITIWVYAMVWGVWFAVGFVLLIFVHECGHLLAARKCGLKVGAPVFIPFMGAFIALMETPRDAWIEAQVGIGGPLLGTPGAMLYEMICLVTGNPMHGGKNGNDHQQFDKRKSGGPQFMRTGRPANQRRSMKIQAWLVTCPASVSYFYPANKLSVVTHGETSLTR